MKNPSIILDSSDLRLLDLLQHDASLSNQALAEAAHLSPATCHRRVKRLRDEGWIERQVAIVSADKLREAQGQGLQALVEVTLDVQAEEAMARFEAHAVQDAAVQQCWRVSPGPDFMLVLAVADMDGYQQVAARLFTGALGVRNVRAFFAVKRAKFDTALPLAWPRGAPAQG
ncbi:Lrp/AsnC family transcriptional regulator [Aquabacterium soli]|uniref:Lrp/AsnC family transcriptional regulator n=1 Tax=Aquabacterium soli TaxID=2493092 RepID=A0A426V8V2_9BURK|nr:Lrp/AsnC family transcriptional regulator [Aquabacterium soli]